VVVGKGGLDPGFRQKLGEIDRKGESVGGGVGEEQQETT